MTKTPNPHSGAPALREAIQKAGGITKLAEQLGEGTKSQTIANWMTRGVPLERCVLIEKVTGVRCEDLNPEIDWKTMREVLCSPARITGGMNRKAKQAKRDL
ncbi:transcriptional regulator [Paraburkholderia caledonica]|uniref:DNA-binding transcriptional regulator YdaS (Cro superfamily) n=1 Tax=Paraburkholderia caledonica TaxID=134536 RepID=A0AB73IPI2_9BURK|nr:DNA-binding transcriptional regulator YdaS (Cro superfamily) [Paraburkholderia caledonica]